ncbi:MAG: fasciclin domain-containing protein [Candidatus Nanopelagicales bacterium]
MRKIVTPIAAASALALAAGAVAPAANAAQGTKSLATVLTSDGGKQFDHNWHDFDIVTEAVLAVLKAKPNSAVGVLTDGKVKLTAFVPNDRAFQLLVRDLTGTKPATEKKTFTAVAGLGIDTVETVLLYHVVPGATITAKQALKANNVRLGTAQGQTIKVQVRTAHGTKFIKLSDKDRNSRNPRVYKADINKGNKQIAHAIDRVLRPFDLPPVKK